MQINIKINKETMTTYLTMKLFLEVCFLCKVTDIFLCL